MLLTCSRFFFFLSFKNGQFSSTLHAVSTTVIVNIHERQKRVINQQLFSYGNLSLQPQRSDKSFFMMDVVVDGKLSVLDTLPPFS